MHLKSIDNQPARSQWDLESKTVQWCEERMKGVEKIQSSYKKVFEAVRSVEEMFESAISTNSTLEAVLLNKVWRELKGVQSFLLERKVENLSSQLQCPIKCKKYQKQLSKSNLEHVFENIKKINGSIKKFKGLEKSCNQEEESFEQIQNLYIEALLKRFKAYKERQDGEQKVHRMEEEVKKIEEMNTQGFSPREIKPLLSKAKNKAILAKANLDGMNESLKKMEEEEERAKRNVQTAYQEIFRVSLSSLEI